MTAIYEGLVIFFPFIAYIFCWGIIMKSKIFFAIPFIFLTLFSACEKTSPNEQSSHRDFTAYSMEEFCVEYYLFDSTQPIDVYFPVVTNKKITSTELGGIAAKFSGKEGSSVKEQLTLTLEPQEQRRMNLEYKGYYISYLTYRVKTENHQNLLLYEHVDLCDTDIWIYAQEEYKTVSFSDTYLKIRIVDSVEEVKIPDWENIINGMQIQIERRISGEKKR